MLVFDLGGLGVYIFLLLDDQLEIRIGMGIG